MPRSSCLWYLRREYHIYSFSYLFIYLYIGVSIYVFIYTSARLSVRPSVGTSVYLYVCPSVHPSIHPSIHTSIRLSIYLYIYPSISVFVCLVVASIRISYVSLPSRCLKPESWAAYTKGHRGRKFVPWTTSTNTSRAQEQE